MATTMCSTISAVDFQSNGCCYPITSSKSLKTNCSFPSFLKPSKLRIFFKNGIVPTHVIRAPTTCCLGGNYSEASLNLGNSDAADISNTEASFDLKLPRRSLLVHFTCNSCGERTKKLISRLAYERGTVFVQYDFREDSGINAIEDQH